jgi:hypothetical protein
MKVRSRDRDSRGGIEKFPCDAGATKKRRP